MSVEFSVQVYVKQDHLQVFERVAEDHFWKMPKAQDHAAGKIYDCERMTLRALHDALEVMEVEEVPCKFLCSAASDPSIADYTAEVSNEGNGFVIKKTTSSVEREIACITTVLEKIKSGESLENIRVHLEEKLKTLI